MALTPVARVLTAADVYQAIIEPRPHRPGMQPDRAADDLRLRAGAGRLDEEVVEAVPAAAGHRGLRSPAGATGGADCP